MAQEKRKILGQILKEMKCVTESQVQEALAIQKQRGGVIGEIPVSLGYVTEADVRRARCKQAGMQEVDLDKVLSDIRRRDRDDSSRAIAPLLRGDDAVLVDTTEKDVDEVVSELYGVISQAGRDE